MVSFMATCLHISPQLLQPAAAVDIKHRPALLMEHFHDALKIQKKLPN